MQGTIKKFYDDNDNVIFPVTSEKCVYMDSGKLLSQELTDVNSQLNDRATHTEVDTKVSQIISGSPKGIYTTLTALQTAFPTGSTGVYVVTADGGWYYWSGSAWVKGGVYQSTGIPDGSITYEKKACNASAVNGNGEFGLFVGGDDGAGGIKYINYKFTSKQIIIPSGWVLFRKTYYIAPAITLDITSVSGGIWMLLFDVVNKTWRVLPYTLFTQISNNEILMAVGYALNGVNSCGKYQINDKLIPDSAIPFNGQLGMFVGEDLINFNLSTNQVIIPKGYVVVKKNYYRTVITREVVTLDISTAIANGGMWAIYFDVTASTWVDAWKVYDYNNINTVTDNQILIATAWIKSNIWTIGNYKIDGVPAFAVNKNRWNGKKGVFLGDSITRGEGGTIPYTTTVKNVLELNSVVNYGINNSTIGFYSDPMSVRYSTMDSDADLIVVMGGVNDFRYNVPIGNPTDNTNSTFYGALNILLDGLITKYPTKAIVYVTPIHYDLEYTANASGKTLKDYVNVIKEMCSKYGIPLFDGYSNSGLNPLNATQKGLLMPDGLHPNNDGYIILGNKIGGFIKTL